MDSSIAACIVVILLLIIGCIILAQRYISLSGTVEARALARFEEWRRASLEKEVTDRADLLCRQWVLDREKVTRADAIKQSEATIRGNITQHLIPFFRDFPWNPRDARFIGTPIDLVVFSGLSDHDEIGEITFVEIKTGKTGALSKSQKKVKEYLDNGGTVKFCQIHATGNCEPPL